MSRFSIEKLERFFSEPEIFFATKMMQKEEEELSLFFFCYLFRSAICGHLCVTVFQDRCLPNPASVLSEEKLESLSLEEKRQFDESVFLGLKKCKSFYQKKERKEQKEEKKDLTSPIIWGDHHIYLQKNWVLETKILQEVKRLIFSSEKRDVFDENIIEKEEKLTADQKQAIKRCLQNKLSIICGGPGTGKSYLAAFLVSLFSKDREVKVFVTAPTGKAAMQLQQKILQYQPDMKNVCFETKTLHSLLQIKRKKEQFSEKSVLEADLIIVDEASMMDAEIMMNFFSSIGCKTQVILMGDVDQLPPVEAGFLFSDLVQIFIKENKGISFLSKALRFENFSLLELAELIKGGKKEELFSFLEKKTISWLSVNFLFSEISKNLSYFLAPNWEKKEALACLDQLEKFCILTPLRRGPFGVEKINFYLKQLLFQKIKIGQWYYLPILVCKNDPEHNLYNGMMGMVVGKYLHKKQFSSEDIVYFRLGKEVLELPAYLLNHYEEAFCVSVHKSQGSEFEKILFCLPPGSEKFGKELFYTGITRAKKELVLVGEREIIEETIKTSIKRNSAIVERFSPIS